MKKGTPVKIDVKDPLSACFGDNGKTGILEDIEHFRSFPYKIKFDDGSVGYFIRSHFIPYKGPIILNLGSGNKLIEGAINVDITPYPGVAILADLSKFPWSWLEDESVDGIYASHIIEHFPDQEKFIWECLRILKKGGFLQLNVPHSSSVSSVGCMGHYRTYSYSTLRGYLSTDYYMFGKAKFRTVYQKLNWWYERLDAQKELKPWHKLFIIPMHYTFNFFANLSPRMCENLWCYYVGGFREVIWRGVKL